MIPGVGFNAPKWIVFQLLQQCNLRCRMCYEWGESGSYHDNENLSMLDYTVVKQVVSDCLPGKPYFGLFGGEPFLHPQIFDIIRVIKEGGCGLDIPTNGTLIENYADSLVESPPNRLWISLDGPPEINDYQRGKGVYRKVIRGIEKLYQIRETKGKAFPKIGVTYILTPWNHTFVEEFFFNCLDLDKIDHLSIEFQFYATEDQYNAYAEILSSKFNISVAPCAKGIVQDPSKFAEMDFEKITDQIKKVRHLCEEKNIYFIAYPKTIELNNIRNFFTCQWHQMVDKQLHCAFPWIYAEVAANGDVTVCHTFYDLPIGNVNQTRILDI
ncbi:MAG: radical SAM protein [Desulfobacterales bacterium]